MTTHTSGLRAVGLALLVALGAAVPAAAHDRETGVGSGASITADPRPLALGVSMLPYEDVATYDAFTRSVRRAPAIWSLWSDWGGRNRDFPSTAFLDHLRAKGTVPMILWQPVDPLDLESMEFSYRRILLGHHDRYIRAWARAARNWGGTVLLRFAHEMDGSWFPWGTRGEPLERGNTPERFLAAWKHIWNHFRGPDGVGATNVKFLWSPLTPNTRVFPNSKYIDYVGFTAFNWGAPRTDTWKSMEQMFARNVKKTYEITGRPIIAAETGSTAVGGDKAAWIDDGYRAVYKGFPSVKAVVYFNIDMRKVGQPDWRLTSPLGALAAYRTLAAYPRFQGVIE